MIERTIERLEELARNDTVAAPLAILQVEVLRASTERAWAEAVPELEPERLADGFPLLHGRALRVDPDRQRRLLAGLAAVAARGGPAEAARLERAAAADTLDPLALLEASIRQDAARLEVLAEGAELEPDLCATLGQLAAVPLLQACRRRAEPLLAAARWEAGYCPLCAAWPSLAELRGLERKRWLRCGRCGAAWWCFQQRCCFCATLDHKLQGYLAPEANRESQRAQTCDGCRGYLKAITTLGPIPPPEVVVYDLTSLELDLAAMQQGYGRPATPGFPLELAVEPARRRLLWLPGRR